MSTLTPLPQQSIQWEFPTIQEYRRNGRPLVTLRFRIVTELFVAIRKFGKAPLNRIPIEIGDNGNDFHAPEEAEEVLHEQFPTAVISHE